MPQQVKLSSSDNEVLDVNTDVIKLSNTIKTMLEDLGDGDEEGGEQETIPLPNVNGSILKKVLQWCQYHKVDQGTLFELILAANYLDIKGLLDVTCKTVANMIKGKTPEEIRKTFNIKNDFTPEEEEQIRKENAWCED